MILDGRSSIDLSLTMLEALLQGLQNISEGPADRWWKVTIDEDAPYYCGERNRPAQTYQMCRHVVRAPGEKCWHHQPRQLGRYYRKVA